MKILAALSVIGMTFATTALAQTSAPPAPPSASQTPQGGFAIDWYSIMAVKSFDNNVVRGVDKAGWSRASRAATAINAGKCGEAATIAAESGDKRLMEGVKRACRAS